jgi:hypothetical protein
MTDRPARIPQQPDVVAHGLSALLEKTPPERQEGLRDYLGLWHRMRGVVFLKMDRGTDAREEIRKGILYSGMSARLVVLYLLSILPGTLSSNFYRVMTKFLHGLRPAPAGG